MNNPLKPIGFLVAACVLLTMPVSSQSGKASAEQGAVPRYEVDLTWPKPLPDRWVLGGLGGLCVDKQDHVFILNRQDVLDADLNAGKLAPPIIEFDSAGTVVNAWGDLKDMDPRLHSCTFDQDNSIWIASSPSGMLRKYTHDGSKLLMQLGKKGALDSSDGTEKGKPLNSEAARFFMPSSLFVDPGNGDVYVADGEGSGGNRRIAVFGRDGHFLRQWLQEDMRTVHCMAVSKQGLVYVCNREGSEIRVFDKMGKFQKSIAVPWTPYTPPANGIRKESGGAAVALDFSQDAAQRFLFLINQNNARIEIIERETGRVVSNFGRSGHFPGEFDQAHGIAVDSMGNIYIAENRGKRVQKFRVVTR